MNVPGDDDTFDPDRILATLDAHRVDHVLIRGFAARAHGATRPTADIDRVPDTGAGNYERRFRSWSVSGTNAADSLS
jgi:hypothetical protein